MGGDKKPKTPALKIDFNSNPTANEEKLHATVKDQVLQQTPELLGMITKYGGCEDVIRKVLFMSNFFSTLSLTFFEK